MNLLNTPEYGILKGSFNIEVDFVTNNTKKFTLNKVMIPTVSVTVFLPLSIFKDWENIVDFTEEFDFTFNKKMQIGIFIPLHILLESLATLEPNKYQRVIFKVIFETICILKACCVIRQNVYMLITFWNLFENIIFKLRDFF